MLYEMLAGVPPFVGEAIEVIASHVQEPAPSLREQIPELPAGLDVLVASMLDKDPARRPTMQRVCGVLARAWEVVPDEEHQCPFPGLRAFSEDDAEMFFGRDYEIEQILVHLARARGDGPRHVVIEGASGTGKSSLLRAGVLSRLRGRDSSTASRWEVVNLRPSDPLENMSDPWRVH